MRGPRAPSPTAGFRSTPGSAISRLRSALASVAVRCTSRSAPSTTRLPVIGHACGHNIIASSAVGAALALAPLVDDLGITLSVIGTPAEEGGGGKILMLERGAFDGVHASLMVHPTPTEDLYPRVSAVAHMRVQYTGRESHAAIAPELGINAADAITVAQVAIGLLRQHLRPFDQVHGIVTHGGDATNVVPAHTEGTWMARSRTLGDLEQLRPAGRVTASKRARSRPARRFGSPTCARPTRTWSTTTTSARCTGRTPPRSVDPTRTTGRRRSRPTWATCRWPCRRSIRASRSRPAARSTINRSSPPPRSTRRPTGPSPKARSPWPGP